MCRDGAWLEPCTGGGGLSCAQKGLRSWTVVVGAGSPTSKPSRREQEVSLQWGTTGLSRVGVNQKCAFNLRGQGHGALGRIDLDFCVMRSLAGVHTTEALWRRPEG